MIDLPFFVDAEKVCYDLLGKIRVTHGHLQVVHELLIRMEVYVAHVFLKIRKLIILGFLLARPNDHFVLQVTQFESFLELQSRGLISRGGVHQQMLDRVCTKPSAYGIEYCGTGTWRRRDGPFT